MFYELLSNFPFELDRLKIFFAAKKIFPIFFEKNSIFTRELTIFYQISRVKIFSQKNQKKKFCHPNFFFATIHIDRNLSQEFKNRVYFMLGRIFHNFNSTFQHLSHLLWLTLYSTKCHYFVEFPMSGEVIRLHKVLCLATKLVRLVQDIQSSVWT